MTPSIRSDKIGVVPSMIGFDLSPITKYKIYVTSDTLSSMIDYISEYCIYLKHENDLINTNLNKILVIEFMTNLDDAYNIVKYIACILRYNNALNIIKIYYQNNDTSLLTNYDFTVSCSIETYGEIHKNIKYTIKKDIYDKLKYACDFVTPVKYDDSGDIIMWNT
jgi:hypothetical protein